MKRAASDLTGTARMFHVKHPVFLFTLFPFHARLNLCRRPPHWHIVALFFSCIQPMLQTARGQLHVPARSV